MYDPSLYLWSLVSNLWNSKSGTGEGGGRQERESTRDLRKVEGKLERESPRPPRDMRKVEGKLERESPRPPKDLRKVGGKLERDSSRPPRDLRKVEGKLARESSRPLSSYHSSDLSEAMYKEYVKYYAIFHYSETH